MAIQFKPHKYQEIAIQHIIDNAASALLLDMGLGKTVSTLTAINELMYDNFEVQKVLVIAPKKVAEDTWSRETVKWDHTSHMTISKVLGSEKERVKALRAHADIYIINRENVVWLVDYYLSKFPFDMVVIDELSSFKSNSAKRFKSLKRVRPLIKRIVGLTGTPAPNSLMDLWPQMYLMDRGERLGKTISEYRERYFSPGASDGHIVYNYRLRDGSEDIIYSRINDICISMKAKDYLQLPKRINNTIEIDLPAKARKQYAKLEKDLVMTLDKGDIVAANAAVLTGKLLQLSNGRIYDENKEINFIHEEKLNALDQIVEEANGKPVLVFYNYKHDVTAIKDRFKGVRDIKSKNAIEDWNAGEIPMLVAHPASAGHGLNLQDGGHIIVWFGVNWSLELYQQANARLDRQGQKNSVIVNHIIAKDTVEEHVMKVLHGKAEVQDAFLEAVKAARSR